MHGDLVSDDIAGVDLSAKYADAVKINEDCVFAGPRLVFQAETELTGEKLSGNLPEKVNTTLAELMGNLRRFVNNLHDFHRDHIDVVVPALDEEIRVAQRLELGVATYLDTSALPAHLPYISVPYTIANIAAVNKITADRIDGVLLSDLCLVDEDCTITCAEGVSPCVHFKQDLTVSGQVSFNEVLCLKYFFVALQIFLQVTFSTLDGRDWSSVLAGLESNSNNYALEQLHISSPTGDLDWDADDTTGSEESVSHLYSNLVVSSDTDWASRNPGDTVTQQITGRHVSDV